MDDDRKGRYKQDYTTTGTYTAKVYETHGTTEVVSLNYGILANLQKVKDLIEKDP